MYNKTESEWTRELCKELHKIGVMTRPLVGGAMTPDGWEDRLIVTRFNIFLVEFKGPKTVVSPQQKIVLRKHHVLTPGDVFLARRNPGVREGWLIHPRSFEPVLPFVFGPLFVKSLFLARRIVQESHQMENGLSLEEARQEYFQRLYLA